MLTSSRLCVQIDLTPLFCSFWLKNENYSFASLGTFKEKRVEFFIFKVFLPRAVHRLGK